MSGRTLGADHTGWQSPELIADDATGSKVAGDPNGDAIVAWTSNPYGTNGSNQSVFANRFAPTNGWGSPELIAQSRRPRTLPSTLTTTR